MANEKRMTPAAHASTSRIFQRAVFATLLGAFWVSLFWFQPARYWPVFEDIYRGTDTLVYELFGLKGTWRWVFKSYVFVCVPIVVVWLLGVPPKALGMGRMAQHGWRIVAVGFALSLPVLVWVGLQPGIYKYYAKMFRADGWDPILANAVVIVVEHAFIEGLLLAVALPPGWRFEEMGPEPRRSGRLCWLGFGNTDGGRGFFDWVGIPPQVLPALVGQALVFGFVHAGKELAELVTSFPGGFGLGLLTYRIRSVWPSVLLHLGTGAIILTTAWLTFGR